MKKILAAIFMTIFSANLALAQTTPFSTFVTGLAPASSISGSEKLIGLQLGINKTFTPYQILSSVLGDCTIGSPPTIVCTKTNNVAFAASATTDTTVATNISSGTLPLPRLALTSASIYVGNVSNNPAGVALSGDCTITNAGAITCPKANGVTFATSATTDTTNATNITTGTLANGRSAATNLAAGAVNGGVTGLLPYANMASGTADKALGYWSTTVLSATSIPNCAGALTYSTGTHTYGCNAGAGAGSVTSVTCGAGLTGGVFTTSGTCGNIGPINIISRAGSLDVWQRGTGSTSSFAILASAQQYTADGWFVQTTVNQASVVSAQPGIAKGSLLSAKIQRNAGQTGTGLTAFSMPLETDETTAMLGNFITVSFTAKAGADFSGTGSSISMYLVCGTGTTPARRGLTLYPGEVAIINSLTNVISTTATRYQATSASTVGTCTQAEIGFVAQPQGTALADDSWTVDDVQVEISNSASSVATPFRYQSFQESYQKSLRFYEKSYNYNTAPGTSAGNQGLLCASVTSSATVANVAQSVTYSVPKRVSITPTMYSGTGGVNNFSSDIGGTTNLANSAIQTVGERQFSFSNSSTAANYICIQFTADASI